MRFSIQLLVMVLVGASIGYFLFDLSSNGEPGQAQFRICVSSVRINCVVDGDTIWYEGKKIRVEDIDAPEISRPKCASEKALGEKAKYRLLELMNVGPFELVRQGNRNTDRYGRLLRVIERDGQSLGMILVNKGLARRWDGRRHPWC